MLLSAAVQLVSNPSFVLFFFLTSTISVVIYRLYFHPLAKFKGPWQAAISEFWIDQQTRGGHAEETFEILHKNYGDILRIGPNELHISDVSSYDKIYGRKPEFQKYEPFYRGFLASSSSFGLIDIHAHHEARRLLNPLFSHGGVAKLEPMVVGRLNLMLDKITKLGRVNIKDAFRCLTTDIISEFSFGKSMDLTGESEDFASPTLKVMDVSVTVSSKMCYKPWLASLLMSPLGAIFAPKELKTLLQTLTFAKNSLAEYHKTKGEVTREHEVVFDRLQSIPTERQISESFAILIAGSDTTAHSLTVGLVHILSNPRIKDRLLKELPEGDFNLADLERVEYLRAVVHETLRIAMPVAGRLPRVTPEILVVKDQEIPQGAVVGMSAWTMHRSEEIWGEDFEQFVPERWLGRKDLESKLVTFSKGPRNCAGMNLAYAEITLVLAWLIRKYDMELFLDKLETKDLFVGVVSGEKPVVKFTPRKV